MLNRSIQTFAFSSAAVCLLFIAPVRGAEKPSATPDTIHAALLADVDAAVPGSAFTLGVHFEIAPHFHMYWINPGEFGNPTRIKFTAPAGFEFGEIQWPLPTRIEHDGTASFGYLHDVLLMVPVKVATSVPPGAAAKITAGVEWFACSDECLEGVAKLDIALPVGPVAKAANGELFEKWKKSLPIDRSQAAEVLSDAGQTKAADGTPMPALSARWKLAPAKVEWFPIATSAISIDDIRVATTETETRISFKSTIYKPDQLPTGKIDSVLVYEDPRGIRHGIIIPIQIKK